MNDNDQPARPFQLRRRILTGCDVLMAVAAAVAIATLALEYGFYDPLPLPPGVLHVIEACVLAAFVLDRFLRLGLSRRRRQFFRGNWFDFVLMAGAAGVAVAVWSEKLHFKFLSVASLYIIITQVYILAVLVTRLVGFQIKVAGSGIHPIWVLIGSFAVVILFGTGLLMLPRAAPPDPVGVQLEEVSESLVGELKLPHGRGALVTHVFGGTPAAGAGMKRGDFIVAVGGMPVEDVKDLRRREAELTPGTKVEFVLYRGGEKKTLPVEVASRPVVFADALFTATSATCVTGLLVRNTGTEWTTFGQFVILALIQLGGLGIMVFGTVFALLAGRALSIRESMLAGQAMANGTIGRIGRMVKFVLLATLGIEAAAAVIMYPMWSQHLQATGAHVAFSSAFHAISAFCNAGFSLQKDSLGALRHHWQVIGVMAPLIVLGGLGFPVLYNLVKVLWARLRRVLGRGAPAAQTLTLHSKLVLSASLLLILGGALVLIILEAASDPGQSYGAPITYQDNPHLSSGGSSLVSLPPAEQAREAVFQSITARTAGFNTVEMNRLSPAGKLWMCLLMIIGGSPASTAGGMKTVTVAILLLTVASMLRRRERVEGFQRTITEQFTRKAVTLAGLYLTLLTIITLLLCVTMNGRRLIATGQQVTFVQLFFEACSACGTVGLTCGVTGSLTAVGKYVIIAGMFIGRLGPLTVLLALTMRLRAAKYSYPSEEVVLG